MIHNSSWMVCFYHMNRLVKIEERKQQKKQNKNDFLENTIHGLLKLDLIQRINRLRDNDYANSISHVFLICNSIVCTIYCTLIFQT